MSEVLSQQEIDKLLGQISANPQDSELDADNRKIKTYDFKRPETLCKYQIKDLQDLADLMTQEVSAHFSKYYKHSKRFFRVVSVDQLTTEEYYRSLPSPTFLYKFDYGSSMGCIDISPGLVLRGFLDKKINYKSCLKIKEFNQFDIDVCKNLIIRPVLDAFHDILQKEISEPLPQMENIMYICRPIEFYYVDPLEMGTLITMEMDFGEEAGLLDIFMTKTMTDLLIKQEVLEMRKRYIIKDGETVGNAYVSLGSRTINEEMKNDIKVGSIVELNTLVGEPVKLFVDGKPYAEGDVVVVDENLGLRITELLNEK